MFENTFIYSISTTCGKETLFFPRSRTSQWRCLFDEARTYYDSILQLDVTELEGLDDLHHPTGVIQEAEHLLAKLYGSDQSFFLVNGTTVGNLAMVMAACRAGDEIFVQRNCHKSVYHAIELAGATPIMVEAEVDPHLYVPTHVTDETVKKP